MANDLMTAELESKALAIPATVDPMLAYADAVAPQYIIGEMLRFVKGDWMLGEKQMELATTFTVNPDELMAGVLKWWDGKPVEHHMVRVSDGIPPKTRTQVGDTDTRQWETDDKGNPKDPWQFTNYLPMMNEDGELFTFVTSSRGGIGAIASLVRRYARHRVRHPDVFPVIKLSVDAYQHKDKTRGRIKVPVFEPAGYLPKTDFHAALATAGFSSVEPEPVEADPADELNDEIPC